MNFPLFFIYEGEAEGQVDGKKDSSADLLEENLAEEAKDSGFLLRESKEPSSGQTQKVPGEEFVLG